MFSRAPERKMRYVRTGLLIAWFVLIGSLFWDPFDAHPDAPQQPTEPVSFALGAGDGPREAALHRAVRDGKPDLLGDGPPAYPCLLDGLRSRGLAAFLSTQL